MQPTFRQTPPSVVIALDEDDLQAEVGGAKRRRVAARAGAEDEQVADRVAADRRRVPVRARPTERARMRPARQAAPPVRAPRTAALDGCGAGAPAPRPRASRPPRSRPRRLEAQDQRALVDLVADRDLQLLDDARMRRRNLHRRLVALDRDQALLDGDGVAGLDEDLDDRDIAEVADVGNPNVDSHGRPLTAAPAGSRRAPGPGRR